ncbi:MAG: molecular chaperone DnaJ [Pseudomonadota bacterium]
MLGFLLLFAFLFVRATPAALASTLRMLGPLLVVLIGLALSALGRFGYGVPLLILGGLWWYHYRKKLAWERVNKGDISTFRTAWLEVLVNQDTGQIDGLILTGPREGKILSGMERADLLAFYQELSADIDSQELVETYLDRKVSGWRKDTDARSAERKRSTPGPGAVTEQEAYQILGLEPGAGAQEISSRHRKLMAVINSEGGTSVYLVKRIDEARDTLLK